MKRPWRRSISRPCKHCSDLRRARHHVEEADPTIDRAAVIPHFSDADGRQHRGQSLQSSHGWRPARQDEVEKVTWASAHVMGAKLSAADYVRGTQTAHKLGRQMAAFHTQYDVLLTPALAMLPPKLGWIDMMLNDVQNTGTAFSPSRHSLCGSTSPGNQPSSYL